MLLLHRLERQIKDFSKPNSNSYITILFLIFFFFLSFFLSIHLELKRQIRSCTGQNEENIYPFSDQNGAKPIPFGAAHIYMAYIREYPPGFCDCRPRRENHHFPLKQLRVFLNLVSKR